MFIKMFRFGTILFILFSMLGTVTGQSGLELIGRVTDGNGAAVPGATVILKGLNVRYQQEVTVGPDGNYSFNNIPSGAYELTVFNHSFAVQRERFTYPDRTSVDVTLVPQPLVAEVAVNASLIAGTDASLSEVPGSIERVDAQTLQNSRFFSFSEALRKVAGVNVREEEGFGLRPNIGIRGTNPTRSTKILLLEDGVPLAYAPYGDNASYYHPPIERYESIEVLKGSGQIAFGPQTIAGLVNYITPNPTEKPSFGVRLSGGNRAFFNGSFSGSGTINKTGIFANYSRKQGNGARENISSKLNDISTKVVQTLNDRNALTLKFSYYGEDSNVTYSGLTTAEYAADPRANPFKNDFFYGDRFGFSASHAGVLSAKAVINTNFYANKFKRHWWRQSSNSGQRPNRLGVDPDCLSMAHLNTTCGNEGRLREYETYGVEPKFTFTYDAGTSLRGELHAGVRGHWEVQKRRQENGDLPNSRSGVASEINERRNDAYSAFVQNRFIFGDLAITPGVRFERINIERTNLLASPIAFGNTTVNEVIPGIGVAYSGLPKTTLFAGIHRGFSPPRAEDIISNSGGVIELDSELSWNYEAGIRTNPFRGLRLEGTYFRLDYENQIVAASLAGGVGATLTNGGETLQQGLEFSGQLDSGVLFESRHNIYLRTAYTWLPTAEFRDIRFSTITPSISITGNRLPYVPETTATTSLGYSHTNGFDAFIENVYVGRQFGDDLNTVNPIANGQRGAIPSQTYWNATANYRIERWKTTFFVTAKNLLDRSFIVDRSRGILPSTSRLVQTGVHIRF
jgi:Fe(3+) dicitrate transport protein